MRKTLGQRKTDDGYRLKTNKITDKFSNIPADARKR